MNECLSPVEMGETNQVTDGNCGYGMICSQIKKQRRKWRWKLIDYYGVIERNHELLIDSALVDAVIGEATNKKKQRRWGRPNWVSSIAFVFIITIKVLVASRSIDHLDGDEWLSWFIIASNSKSAGVKTVHYRLACNDKWNRNYIIKQYKWPDLQESPIWPLSGLIVVVLLPFLTEWIWI